MSNSTHHKAELLDTLTRALTAFESWADMTASMRGGYCPTIRSCKLRKNATVNERQEERAKEVFREMIRAEGFKVYEGHGQAY